MANEILYAVSDIERRGKFFHRGNTYQIAVEAGQFIFRNGFYDPLVLNDREGAESFAYSVESRFRPYPYFK